MATQNTQPVYTYNDYRLTYNEPYFYYNGGFDLTTIVATFPRRGASTNTSTIIKTYPQPNMLEVLFKTKIYFVNNEHVQEHSQIKKYNIKKNDIRFFLKELKQQKTKYCLTSNYFSPKIIHKHMKIKEKIITNPKKTLKVPNVSFFSKSTGKVKLISFIFKT